MSSLLEQLRSWKAECEGGLQPFETGALGSLPSRAENAGKVLRRSFSGSWLGYHARVYLEDFASPGPGVHFDPEWGFEEAFSNQTSGPWIEYAEDVVRNRFCEVAQVTQDEIATLIKASDNARASFNAVKQKLVPALSAALTRSADPTLEQKLESISTRQAGLSLKQIIKHIRPKGQFATRDPRVVGVDTPPHVQIACELQEKLSYRFMLERLNEDIEFLINYLSALEPAPILPKESDEMTNPGPPAVFIGSSAEGLPVAEAIQRNLDHSAEVTIWSQGVFGLSRGTLETLVSAVSGYDFAILVLTPDDVSVKKDNVGNAPRDNVLFELGLFMGALGRERTFVVNPRDVAMDMPSDLAGVATATYASKRADGNLLAALGAACTDMKAELAKTGKRSRASAS